MPTEHEATVRPNAHEAFSVYKFEAICKCQWQALAHTEEAATAYVKSHLKRWGALPEEKAIEATPPLPPDAVPIADPRPESPKSE